MYHRRVCKCKDSPYCGIKEGFAPGTGDCGCRENDTGM